MAKRSSSKKKTSKSKAAVIPALELGERLAKGERQRCYLLLGEESFLRDEALQVLRDQLIGPELGPSYREVEGPKADLADVLDELRTMPFFGAGHRLVVVRRAGAIGNAKGFAAEHGDVIATFLAKAPDTSTLVLTTSKLDGRYSTCKKLKAAATVVDCGPPGERTLTTFLRGRAAHWGRSFARGAAESLLERLGGQEIPLAQLDAEVRKIASGGQGPITREEVDALGSLGSSTDGFQLINRIGAGDAEGALEVLHTILRDGLVTGGGGRTTDPSGIAMILVPTLRWDLMRLMRGRTLLDQGERGFDVAKTLRVFRDKAAFLDRARRADRDTLAARYQVLRLADAALRSSSSAERVLTETVLRLVLSERACKQKGRALGAR